MLGKRPSNLGGRPYLVKRLQAWMVEIEVFFTSSDEYKTPGTRAKRTYKRFKHSYIN